MTDLREDFCRMLGTKRRERGISQTLLAREVGCGQSALSMFEQGDGTKLNEEVIRKICDKFGVAFPDKVPEEPAAAPEPAIVQNFTTEHGFCPNPHCPSNNPYEVDGRVYCLPDRAKADPVHGKYCAMCGEVLEKRCPNCGAVLHTGAVCSHCGKPYVAVL